MIASEAKNIAKNKTTKDKQLLERLPIALAQVKAGNISEILLNKIRKICYSLHQSKEITKKKYTMTKLSQCNYKNRCYIYELRT